MSEIVIMMGNCRTHYCTLQDTFTYAHTSEYRTLHAHVIFMPDLPS